MSIEDLTGTVVRKICMACSREFQGATGNCPHDGNVLVALPQDPYVGRRIADKYQVLSVLGTGGMGVVYLARHETMQCNVAIKMLRAQFVGDQMSVKRFTQEAIAARRLTHPNVITTYDHGFTPQGQPYIVMDCLQGFSLADEIKKAKQIGVDRVIHIFSQACDALDHAHKQGVIHRDLKPGNIMLINYNDDPDFVKVVDFGVAKIMPINNEESQTLTQAGEVCGSPVYMSPEQCLGQPLDRRADIYSMGIVIYEALTGKLPLMGKNMVDTMSKHINQPPPPFKDVRPDLYIPERLEQVVMKALSKNADGRQQSMAFLKQELQFSVPRPGQNPNLRSASSLSLPEDEAKKNPWLIPVVVSVVTALVVGIAAFVLLGQQKSAPSKPTAITSPPVNATPNPVSTTTTSNPGTLNPATANPNTAVQTPPVNPNPTTTAVTTTPKLSPTATVKVPVKPVTQAAVVSTPVEPPPVKHVSPAPKHVVVKKIPKVVAAKPHHSAAPAPKGGEDKFAALGNERSYLKNH